MKRSCYPGIRDQEDLTCHYQVPASLDSAASRFGAQGQAVDIEVMARRILYHKSTLNSLMANHTGQPFEERLRKTH
jgi:hypothetical protein